MLVILNTQFMLVQAQQHYKLFSNSTNLWTVGANLLLVVGHSLAVVPFLLDTERLCALIGSHKPIQPLLSKVIFINAKFSNPCSSSLLITCFEQCLFQTNEVEQILEMVTDNWDDAENGKSVHMPTSSNILSLHKTQNCLESVSKLVSQGYSQAM